MTITIAGLYTYPLKSGKAISLDTMELTHRGPEHDRMWMLVHADGDKKGRFISQRDKGCEKMALIAPAISENGEISFSVPSGDQLANSDLDLKNYDGQVKVQRDLAEALDAGDIAAAYFSDYLGIPCRLVTMPENYVRSTDSSYSQAGDQVGYADGFPLLVTNTASLDSLSAHFPENANIGMDRFRANIVLDGAEAFEEDVIYQARIGDVELEFVKPCTRCPLPNVDQETGARGLKEPLKTLGQVRRGKSDDLAGVFFGHNAVPRTLGTLSIGDQVEIISRKPMHPAFDETVLKFEPEA